MNRKKFHVYLMTDVFVVADFVLLLLVAVALKRYDNDISNYLQSIRIDPSEFDSN
jgi:ABC-type enterochelin transport system permease subunit